LALSRARARRDTVRDAEDPVMRASVMIALGLGLCLGAACKKTEDSSNPETGSNLLGPVGKTEDAEDLVSDGEDGGDEDGVGGEDDMLAREGEGDEPVAEEPVDPKAKAKEAKANKLPPKAKPVQKCTGKGKKRVCKEVDPKPEVSASYGVVAMMGEYKWGMSPDAVFKTLTRDIEKEYEGRQAKAKDALAQDHNIKWRKEQLQQAKENHVKFSKSANHRWGVSLIQFEYEDDNSEEMLWTRNDKGLRKYFFFKDGELWKILYAYSTDMFPGKTYEQVNDEKFKKWFGISPADKVKQDPKTGQPLVRYHEWTAMKGEKIRAFDMTSVHGVMVVVMVDGKAEKRIGERIPNLKKDESVQDVVGDVLGGSDVCYDKSGNIVECGGEKK
jgi:hypothetical protein